MKSILYLLHAQQICDRRDIDKTKSFLCCGEVRVNKRNYGDSKKKSMLEERSDVSYLFYFYALAKSE